MKKVLMVSTLGIFLSGCLTAGMVTQQVAGSVVGAAAGGLLGSRVGSGKGQLAATAIGTLLGGVVGNLITQPLEPEAYEHQQTGYYYEPKADYYYDQPAPKAKAHTKHKKTAKKPAVKKNKAKK